MTLPRPFRALQVINMATTRRQQRRRIDFAQPSPTYPTKEPFIHIKPLPITLTALNNLTTSHILTALYILREPPLQPSAPHNPRPYRHYLKPLNLPSLIAIAPLHLFLLSITFLPLHIRDLNPCLQIRAIPPCNHISYEKALTQRVQHQHDTAWMFLAFQAYHSSLFTKFQRLLTSRYICVFVYLIETIF